MRKKEYLKEEYKSDETLTCWWCGTNIKPGQSFVIEKIKNDETGVEVHLVMHKRCANEFENTGGWCDLYEF